MNYVPAPGHVVGVYKPGANFGGWPNDLVLARFQGQWRFGWILQTLNNGASAMLGVFLHPVTHRDLFREFSHENSG